MTALWPHQQAAIDKIAPLGRGMLAMDMGCGKTLTALELLRVWDCRRVLILCPKSVVQVWQKEFCKHLGSAWRVVALDNGTVAKRAEQVQTAVLCSDCDGSRLAVVVNYDALTYHPLGPMKTQKGVLLDTPWDCLVMDESHRLKSPHGRQSMVAREIADKTTHRLGLTGTPMPHSPLDIWGQFRAIEPRLYGWRYKEFEAKYAVWGPERTTREGRTFREIEGFQNTGDLHRRMYTHAYRVKSDDVLSLPETMDIERYCLLEPKSRRVYDALETDLRAEIEDGTVTAANALTKLLRLAQVANGFTKDDETGETRQIGSEKADLLADVIADIPQEEPLVVFGRFHHDLETVHAVCRKSGRRSCELSGRIDELASWQSAGNDGPTVIAVQLKAGGLGVDFTRARLQVYFALDYSLGDYLQTRKRIHRPGQTRNVTYIHLIAAGTVDEDVHAALATRQDVVNSVLDGLHQGRQAA